ncbi:MAG TPA: DUF4230 domain-containing protein [Saprospiraceae bacterium]|nr:DUF4230 domain-containing protein [Saprospiraceae bacterium]
MSSSPNIAIGRVIIFVLIVSIVLVVALKFWPRSGSNGNSSLTGTRDNIGINTNIPKEIQVKYLPASFRFEIDEEDAIAIITNPLRYKREFNDLVRNINLAILDHVSNRMNLEEDTRQQIRQEYEKSHAYLRNMYYQDFVSLRDSTSMLAQRWYSKEAGSAIEVLHEVASKYTCFLVNQIMATVLETEGGSFYGKGKKVETPCGIAIQEALNPMFKKFQESAAIQDFSRSKNMLEERIEREVIELATYELQSKKGLSKQLKTKLFGLNVSTTNLEISAISVMKIGFDLKKFFQVDLNPKNQVVTISLPQPEILSHSVYPNADKLDIGWMREVSESDLNLAFEALREEFVREARREDGFDKAKAHAQKVMEVMMGPTVAAFNPNYKLRISFQSGNNNLDPDLVIKDEFSDLDN